MKNILNKILENKKKRINIYKKENPENKIINNIKNVKNFIDFKDKLKKSDSNKKISIIAEIKKASPSAGVLVENFNHLNIARLYVENGASFLSVLTEEDFFQGKMEFIQNIKENFKIPVLCKDFFIDTYQVLQAKSYGADCILIILSAVDKMLAKDLYQTAKELNISTLVEVHSKNEAEIALSFEDSLIGINNRNLQTLEISLNTSIELSKILSSHKNPIICESGINTTENIKFIVKNAKIYSFLIGESLLKSDNIRTKLKEFAEITL